MAQIASSGEVGRLINLMPVGLKEAAIDSPTARATLLHYGEQMDLLERWLDDYLKSTNRLLTESTTLENILNNFTSHAILPTTISETMLDHDYSVLAVKKYSESAKDFWMSMVSVVKRLSTLVCEPIRQFQSLEIRPLKEARRSVEMAQKNYDALQSKYAAIVKTKEPSSIREDAFQLHEARKQYLRTMMDFFTMTPQFRFALDKLIVKIFYDQYKEMRLARDNTANTFHRNSQEMERVQGWVREMEDSERIFKKELNAAKKQLEDAAELAARPSRELDDYSVSTVPNIRHVHNVSGAGLQLSPERASAAAAEKQGWLYLRTYGGKPTRAIWIKRWAFVRNGVFGWLVQGSRAGGVEESERIGVLLCSIRPAPNEERRFCFELKTNKNTIVLQAETQAELLSWMREIEAAKAKAVENPASSDALTPGLSQPDPAFAITAPPVPEFGTLILKSTELGASDDLPAVLRSETLPPSLSDNSSQVDLLRRPTGVEETSKDHASRIMSKLDLHRRTPTGPQVSSPGAPTSGGIASLIAASHGSMPVGPSLPMVQNEQDTVVRKPIFTLALRDMPASTLAPSTLTNIPAPTSLSRSAVVVAGERGIRGSLTAKDGIPNSILANTWGSSNGSYVNKFERSESRATSDIRLQPSPILRPAERVSEPTNSTSMTMDLALPPSAMARSRTPSPSKGRRQTISIDRDIDKNKVTASLPDYPSIYPLQLKTQDAQFRLLFPNVRRDERLVLVFRATWNPNDQQEFPGRIYVTAKEIYFYSNHFGLVLTSSVSLSSIEDVTAAPGKDCDFLFMHLKEDLTGGTSRRVTIKTFLEPLRLLQRRLNFLAQNSVAENPLSLENVIKRLLTMENEVVHRSPSLESWEDVSPDTPVDIVGRRSRSNTIDMKAPVRVDRTLFTSVADQEERTTKFKLPAQPVKYSPPGYHHLAVEREYDLSPKALFHVMFGDKSLLWQLLQHERQARDLKQGPWTPMGEGRLYRDFEFAIPTTNILGQERMSTVRDYQFVDVNNDHLCYVVTDKRTAWHLPNQKMYRLVSKIVITHVAKSKCKLAIYTKVEWLQEPWYLKNVLDRQAMHDLDLDALDVVDLVTDQVRKLGAHSRTKKAVQIFGAVGQSSDVTQLQIERSAIEIETRRSAAKRTMTGLVAQDMRTFAQTTVGAVLEGIINFAKWSNKTISANTFILLLLSLSAMYNSWFVLRDGRGWYQDRSTAKFLKRIGVGPNNVMSKAVYVSDIHEVMTGTNGLPNPENSICYQVFHDEHQLHDLDAPIIVNNRDDTILESAKRIQETRQRLGEHRHDLLVAMRVVNSIEKEVIASEWESWLTAEHRKCRAIEPMIEAAANGTRVDIESSQEVKKWYDSYCVSCSEEYAKSKIL